MDLGVHVASFSWPGGRAEIGPTLGRIAQAADSGGFVSLQVMDHFFQLEAYAPAEEPMLEGYATLGFFAALTSAIQLRLLVTGVTYRHPGLLAKIVSTLDVLSGGRAELGIGAAWYAREHDGLGVPFPPLGERFERLEETLQICLQMWSDDTGRYEGTHYRLTETLNQPQPISRPHPPIMVGGNGERKTLRLAAQYGNACNLIVATPEEVAHKLDVLRRHCEAVGTDYDAIRKTNLYIGSSVFKADDDALVDELRALSGAGIDEVQIMPVGPDPVAVVERIAANVVPRLAE